MLLKTPHRNSRKIAGPLFTVTERILTKYGVPGLANSYDIKFTHTVIDWRTTVQLRWKSLPIRRRVVGGKLCSLLNKEGLVAWDHTMRRR